MDVVEAEERTRVIRKAERNFEELTADAKVANPKYESVLVEGNPETALVNYIEEQWPDLVVTGTQGQAGVPEAAIGSVTEQFLHVLRCDVLAVRPLS